MLSISRTYFWIFIYILVIQVLAPAIFKSADELGVMFMGALIVLDILVNRNAKRYAGIFIVTAIMAAYAVYSIVALKFNTTKAVLIDFVIELKPFIALFIGYSIAPTFKTYEKQIGKATAVAIALFVFLLFISGHWRPILFHRAYVGSTIYLCFLCYLFCSVNNNGKVSWRDIAISIVILCMGLVCTRSKYYGEMIMALFMLLAYRPGMFSKISLKQVVVPLLLTAVIVGAAWEKINYYFFSAPMEDITVADSDSFARPALLGGALLILSDHPILGSGLASYATFASSPDVNYSAIYANYDLDKVYGLSESYYEFICDTFYASLAQFGIVGIALLTFLFVWIYKRLRLVLHNDNKYHFIIGVLTIAYVLIENVGSTLFTQSGGLFTMLLLGQLIGKYRNVTPEQRKAILSNKYATKIDLKQPIITPHT